MSAKAFDVQENIRKEFARSGSGSWPIIFLNEDGTAYEFKDVVTDEENGFIVVKLT